MFSRARTTTVGVEAHQVSEVIGETAAVKGLKIRESLTWECRAGPAKDRLEPNEKLVHLVRHGEGYHNVAQREWRDAGKPGEPYTLDNDPEEKLRDPELTDLGQIQASQLPALKPDLILVSPMRRATQTALQYDGPVLALEDLHETGGRHTCDRRLNRTALRSQFPRVDYSLITEEDDPLWHDTQRETKASIATRAANFLSFLRQRPENNVLVATHSGFLLTLLNAVLIVDDPDASLWFATGECRSFTFSWSDKNNIVN